MIKYKPMGNINYAQIVNAQTLLQNNNELKPLQIGKQRIEKLLDEEHDNTTAPRSYEYEKMVAVLEEYKTKIAYIMTLKGCE